MLGLHCFTRACFSCGKWGLLSSCVQASHCGGFSCWGAWVLGAWPSLVVVHGPSCLLACGILPHQRLDPRPQHWHVDSPPLDHQGSGYIFLKTMLLFLVRGLEIKDSLIKKNKIASSTQHKIIKTFFH